jgi:hypothetical protein
VARRTSTSARPTAVSGSVAEPALRLTVLPGMLAIARLSAGAPLPPWADGLGPLRAVVRTEHELSVVCAQDAVPADVRAQRGWRALEVAGPLDPAMIGVAAALTVPLADAAVPVLVVATFDTDYLLVPGAHLPAAVAALRGAGHELAGA